MDEPPPASSNDPPPEPPNEPSPPASTGRPSLISVEEGPPLDTGAILRDEEVVRARVFFRSILAILVLAGAFLPVLPGTVAFRVLIGAFFGAVGLLCAGAVLTLRDEQLYTARFVVAMAVSGGVMAPIINSYFGLFSAASMVPALAITFFGMSQSRAAARSAYGIIAGLYFLGTTAIAAGLIPDPGLFSATTAAPIARWYQVAISQLLFGMTFYLARSSRRATEDAIERVNDVNRQIRLRDAQLTEARRELDRVLRPGEGRRSGDVVGSFRLGDLVGRGGMGEVYRATPLAAGEPVAVKLLHANMVENPDNVKRFMREAQAAAAVKTEHVAQVLDVGTAADGTPYLVMELLEGHDLGWHLRKAGPLPLEFVVDLVRQVAHAVAAVRDAGIVHRDLKPGNLFLTDSIPPRWKVLDFGLSKILAGSSGGGSLTRDQAVGTPSYMAPEQVHAGDIDHLADLYALAAIAYRAITGSLPFSGDEVAHLLFKVLYTQPTQPARLVKVPVDVELVLAIGMAKRPSDRFGGVEELAQKLALAAAGELDDRTRARGWALIKQYPWGTTRTARDRMARRPVEARA